MIVSILQLMGFPMGKPVHSRAEETPPKKTQKAPGGNKAGTTDHGQPSAARRQEVKTQSGKSTKAEAPAAKPKVAVAAGTKPAAKPAPKAPAKPAAKPVVKAAPQPAPKVPAKAAAKALAQAPVKAVPSAKPAAPAKVPAAPPVKAATKPVAKPAMPPAPPVSTPPRAVVSPVSMSATKVSPKAAAAAAASAAATAPAPAKASFTSSIPAPAIVPANPMASKKDPKLANNWKTKAPADLTDAELLAMPDSEYMNNTQLAVFRLKLSKLKSDILNSAGETTEHLREDTSVVPDPADRATIEEEHALELRTRDRERKLLKKIEQSIARIDAGDYGYCDETGEAIGVGRLLARPTATLSLEAQQRRELKQKMFGD